MKRYKIQVFGKSKTNKANKVDDFWTELAGDAYWIPQIEKKKQTQLWARDNQRTDKVIGEY